MRKRTRGFTLIELLIVIAIIGVLSSIVLGALGTARSKGVDSKTRQQLGSLRSVAEIYFASNGHYGTAASDDCVTSDFFSDVSSGMSKVTDATAYPAGATLSCHTDGMRYAVSGILPGSGGTVAWCVDSRGNAIEIPATLGAGETNCP